jgi:DNA-binding LytR/AlgR family response regulator
LQQSEIPAQRQSPRIAFKVKGRLTRFFATETDSGIDTSRLITDRFDCPALKIAGSEINNRGRLATSGRTLLPGGEVFVDDETHAKSNGVSGVARIAIKAKGRVLFVDPIDVFVARAQGNYVALVHKSGSYLVRETMATAEQKLTPLGFVRIHRAILVNATLVKDLRRDNTGTYVLRTTDGSEHPVGRAYKGNLKLIARSWLGVELV